MDVVHSKGKVAKQAHVGIPEGTFEEEHGRETFFGRASHLYRSHPPTAWTRIEGPLRPRALNLNDIKPDDQADPNAEWALIAGNEDVRLYVSRLAAEMPYYLRDADGDVCYFVHRGEGTLETDYGPLTFKPGDYLIVPKGTTHRLVPSGDDNFFFIIEGSGEYRIPDRGLMGKHAQFDPGMMEAPDPDPHDEAGEFEVRVKRDGVYTSLWFAWHPLDVVGWQGDVCPVKLNVLDHRPVYSPSYHMPPSAHCTWENDGFVICSFVPRPLEEDPAVLKVPFYHANIDADEVLFYHAGNFFSRADIDTGYMTLHPQGIHHGPQPAAIEASKTKERTDEVAVMVETHNPLKISPEAEAVVITEYETSWARGMGLLD
jgi:homogentisate 1,2-dioxygenase